MESLLLRCNNPFHFCSKDTHITFLLINFYSKMSVPGDPKLTMTLQFPQKSNLCFQKAIPLRKQNQSAFSLTEEPLMQSNWDANFLGKL